MKIVRFVIALALVALGMAPVNCRAAGDTDTTANGGSHYRVSLLIGSPGLEYWASCGHACIRIIDSTRTGPEFDKIYNFGVMETFPESVIHQFLTKRVKASFDSLTFSELAAEYIESKRGLVEYELELTPEQKKKIYLFVRNQLDYRNRYYDYAAFSDNCATRIRDLFEQALGAGFVLGNVNTGNDCLTVRNICVNRYCRPYGKHWFGLGSNILCGSLVDRPLSNRETMFLPVYLAEGIKGATIDGKKLYEGKSTVIFPDTVAWQRKVNQPFLIALMAAALTIASLLYRKSRVPGAIVSTLVLFCTGALGCFILYTWWLDGEPSWTRNFNVLWALPTNLLLPFLPRKAKTIYAAAAICLIQISVLMSILGVQGLALFELAPAMLALIFIYGVMYRRNSQ